MVFSGQCTLSEGMPASHCWPILHEHRPLAKAMNELLLDSNLPYSMKNWQGLDLAIAEDIAKL